MRNLTLAIVGILVVALGVLAFSALFTVNQAQQAIVLQFGEPRRVIKDPGLNWKLPFIQNVVFFDKRVLELDPPPEQVLLSDQKRINVNAFARYRILDPLIFFQAVRDEFRLRDRLGKTLNSGVRDVLALHPLTDLLSEKRGTIMNDIDERMRAAAGDFGIEIVDVRIGRTDLPEEISNNVYDRMRSERLQEANKDRAEGQEINLRIRAEADRERTVILADAQRQSQILRGQGEGTARSTKNRAFGQDAEFYEFYRSLEAYGTSFGDGTSLVLSPDSDFFRFFGNIDGSAKRPSN